MVLAGLFKKHPGKNPRADEHQMRPYGSAGAPRKVAEKSGSERLKQWNRLVARVLKVGGRTMFAGGSLHFDAERGKCLADTKADIEQTMEQGQKRP